MKPIVMENQAGIISIAGGMLSSGIAAEIGYIDIHLLFNTTTLSIFLFETLKVAWFGAIGGAAGWLIKEALTYFKTKTKSN